MQQLKNLDLNLLLCLDALIQERHVTRAAKNLHVTQSAMSQALRRLRESLDDPLLVRAGNQMMLSPRAKTLKDPLRNLLSELNALLKNDQVFFPLKASAQFRFSCLDAHGFTLIPELFRTIARCGPRLKLTVVPFVANQVWQNLLDDHLDLALFTKMSPPDFIATEVVIEACSVVSMVREDHPILKEGVHPESFCRYPHINFQVNNIDGPSLMDKRLADMQVSRQLVGTVPSFLTAPALVSQSNYIVTVPHFAAIAFEKQWPVKTFSPPLDTPINFDLMLGWPKFRENDAKHRWFRDTTRTIIHNMYSSS